MDGIIDTNLLIRFLSKDDVRKADKVEKLLYSDVKLLLLDIVVAEVVWVLSSAYKEPKSYIIDKLESLFALESIVLENKETIRLTIDIWMENNIEYIDSYILANKKIRGDLKMYTFDRKANLVASKLT